MKKILTLLAFICTCVLAQSNGNESQNIINSSSYGKEVVTEQNGVSLQRDVGKEYYRREAIYNWVVWSKGQNNKEFTAKQANLINVVDENVTQAVAQGVKAEDSNMTISGYCLIKQDIMVGEQPGAGMFICNTNIGHIEVFGNLMPVNKAYTLIYDPSYIEYKKWRYRVIKSQVLNEARTSYNIATYVNDRKLAEIALTSTSNAADVIKTQSSEYLRELEESRKKNTVEYANVGQGANSYIAPIQQQNTEKPNAADYIVKAGIDIVSGIVKTTADVFKKDLPYLYEIVGGSRIYVNLVIDKRGEQIQWKWLQYCH